MDTSQLLLLLPMMTTMMKTSSQDGEFCLRLSGCFLAGRRRSGSESQAPGSCLRLRPERV